MSTLKRYNLLTSWYQPDTRYRHVLHSQDASDHNNMLIHESIYAWSMIIEDLLILGGFSIQQRNAKLRTWHKCCVESDFALIIGTCKNAYDLLIALMAKQENNISYTDFKDQLASSDFSAASIGLLLSPISDHIRTCLCTKTYTRNHVFNSGASKSLEMCSMFLSFPKKINFTEVGLEAKALMDYKAVEERNAQFTMPEERIICNLRRIITDWFKDYRYDFSLVRHGSGSVADSKNNKSAKYKSFRSDRMLKYFLESSGGLTYDHKYQELNSQLFAEPNLIRRSKLVFVPKDVTKLRSISMEPASLQYLQQAAMRSISQYMKTHKVGKHIKLHDQGQNRALAYDGSCTNKYATLDLSSASDSVIWAFIRKICSGCPHLLKVLTCTRSTHTLLPTGDVCELTKFAPMGSALCFPIESLVFAAIAKLAVLMADELGLLTDPESGSHSTFFSVFGDDIILPSNAAKICSDLLSKCGFTLNKDKSFLDGPFKESCGGNYFCGHDVTGLKFKPDFDEAFEKNVSPSCHDALIMYANMAYTRHFKVFRCYCIHKLLDAGLKPCFTDNPENSSMILSDAPTNFHLKQRYNKLLQVEEVFMTQTRPIQRTIKSWENEMYHEWMLGIESRPSGLWVKNRFDSYTINDIMSIPHNVHSLRETEFIRCWTNNVSQPHKFSSHSDDEQWYEVDL